MYSTSYERSVIPKIINEIKPYEEYIKKILLLNLTSNKE